MPNLRQGQTKVQACEEMEWEKERKGCLSCWSEVFALQSFIHCLLSHSQTPSLIYIFQSSLFSGLFTSINYSSSGTSSHSGTTLEPPAHLQEPHSGTTSGSPSGPHSGATSGSSLGTPFRNHPFRSWNQLTFSNHISGYKTGTSWGTLIPASSSSRIAIR